jgi:hypothetical protein
MKCLLGHKKLDERNNGQKSVITPHKGGQGPGLGCCVEEEEDEEEEEEEGERGGGRREGGGEEEKGG